MNTRFNGKVAGMQKYRMTEKDWENIRKYKEDHLRESGRAERNWETFDPSGNVYLIGSKALGYYKIGLTRNTEAPDKRFKTIQNSVPFELDVLKYWFASHAGAFERLLHYTFVDKKLKGEWFGFAADELEAVVERIKYLAEIASNPISINNLGNEMSNVEGHAEQT